MRNLQAAIRGGRSGGSRDASGEYAGGGRAKHDGFAIAFRSAPGHDACGALRRDVGVKQFDADFAWRVIGRPIQNYGGRACVRKIA